MINFQVFHIIYCLGGEVLLFGQKQKYQETIQEIDNITGVVCRTINFIVQVIDKILTDFISGINIQIKSYYLVQSK